MNQLQQQCSQMSAQEYLQSLQMFAGSLPAGPLEGLRQGVAGVAISNAEQQLNNLASSAPSSGFMTASTMPGPQKSLDIEMPTGDSSSKDSPLASNSSGLSARNRRTFSGSGQTISQTTRDRLKTMIATKKQKQRLHSASSIGSQSSMIDASSSSNLSWLKGGSKAGSNSNLISPLSPGPATVAKILQQQQTPSLPAPMTLKFEPYPNPANANPASQLSEFQLRKVNRFLYFLSL